LISLNADFRCINDLINAYSSRTPYPVDALKPEAATLFGERKRRSPIQKSWYGDSEMRFFGILISILIASWSGSCCPPSGSKQASQEAPQEVQQDGSHYIRDSGPGSPVIIFLHGVLGDSKSTWTNGESGAYWPNLLTQDDVFSGTSIFVHDYVTGMFERGSLNIDELAGQLKVRLDAAGVMERGPLIFVAHSMGGLVVRDFLLKYRDKIVDKTKFTFFLATPTTGAEIAKWATLVSRNPQFREMEKVRSFDYLEDIERNWQASESMKRIPAYCLYEKQGTYGHLVVDMTSASHLCNTEPIAVQANHIDIAKPVNPTALQYEALKTAFSKEMVVTSKQALVDRGFAFLANRDYSRALKDFNEVLRLDPEYVPALKNRGNVYLDTDDYGRAIEDYNKLIRLEPEYAEHFYNRGAAYFGNRDYDRAIEDFTKAIRFNFSDKALALYARGGAKQRKDDRAGGQADLAEARAIDPKVDGRPQATFFAGFAPAE
jgi:tetratricopeptide (TPR) repeat protein